MDHQQEGDGGWVSKPRTLRRLRGLCLKEPAFLTYPGMGLETFHAMSGGPHCHIWQQRAEALGPPQGIQAGSAAEPASSRRCQGGGASSCRGESCLHFPLHCREEELCLARVARLSGGNSNEAP